MADTKTLKERLQARIREFQEKLRAVEMVEQLEAEMNGSQPTVAAPSRPQPVRRTVQLEPQRGERPTVIDLCKAIALGDADREITVGWMTTEVHRGGRPDAERANVSVSLKRLADAGFLQKVRTDHKLGNVYRVKTIKAAS